MLNMSIQIFAATRVKQFYLDIAIQLVINKQTRFSCWQKLVLPPLIQPSFSPIIRGTPALAFWAAYFSLSLGDTLVNLLDSDNSITCHCRADWTILQVQEGGGGLSWLYQYSWNNYTAGGGAVFMFSCSNDRDTLATNRPTVAKTRYDWWCDYRVM